MTWLHLILFAAALSVVAPRWLIAARWVPRAPRWGLAAWYATLAAWASAVAAGLVLLATGWAGAWESACALWAWCFDALAGDHGIAGRVLAAAIVLAGAAAAGRLGWSTAGAVGESLRRRREHAQTVRLVGRVDPGLGATVVAHPVAAAWLVPGGRGMVVVTSAAVEQLRDDELAGVLAHERAHARGRHHLLVTAVTALARAFPTVALFGHAKGQVMRLVEMSADDAVAGDRRVDLARALVHLAQAASTPAPGAAAGMLSATGGDVLERVHRLLNPPAPLPRATRVAVAVASAALVVSPAAWVAAAHAVPRLAGCLPLVS